MISKDNILDGKRVIFIGNSHTYYSRCVMPKGQDARLEERKNDCGIFYLLCKLNGANVNVTNYTFGMHQLSDFYSHSCAADRGHDGFDHLAEFSDFNYDYVIVQQGTNKDTDLVADVRKMLAPFKTANPDVKCIFLMHLRAYTENYSWITQCSELVKEGVTVVDWGGMLHGVLTGRLVVPGSNQSFDLHSFVISRSAKDGFHPNLLAGYITALMTYCAITKEKAEGQPWEFTDGTPLGTTEIAAFRNKYYTFHSSTNFDVVLQTKSEMVGFQQLIDRFMQN